MPNTNIDLMTLKDNVECLMAYVNALLDIRVPEPEAPPAEHRCPNYVSMQRGIGP